MKNRLFNPLACLILILVPLNAAVFGQMVKISSWPIKSSSLIDDLKTYKNANSGLALEDFVKNANSMLENQGLNYDFLFDAGVCQKVEQIKQADPLKPVVLRTKLKSVTDETAELLLPEVQFEKSECGRCFVQIPALSMTDKDFVTKIQEKNINFYLPPNFVVNEAILVDSKDLSTVIQRWKIPFRATPISVSDDGKILYLGFGEKELDDLVLIVFSEGTILFGAKKDVDVNKKGVLLRDFPREANNPNLSVINFKTDLAIQTIKFSEPCRD